MLFLVLLLLASSCLISEGFESSDHKLVEKYVVDFYDYDKKTDKLSDVVKEVQRIIGIAEDGLVTNELLAYIAKSRCGRKDKEKKTKRYVLMTTKWDKGMTYKFYIHDGRHPVTMSPAEIVRAINVGIQYWSSVADINFELSKTTKGAMFSISFVEGKHSMFKVHENFAEVEDPYPIDNVPGRVLAHAFNPKYGNLHLDSAERWTEGIRTGTNLRLITAHEMGHAIGLDHSKIRKALMYPYYTGYISESDFKLYIDDIEGIQAIYGPRKGMRFIRSSNENHKRSQDENPLCKVTNIYAVFDFSDGHTYVVSDGNKVYRSINHTIDNQFQSFTLQENLQNSDAILFDHSRLRLVVIRGDKVFSATGSHLNNLTVTEMKINRHGAFQGKVSAVFAKKKTYKSRSQPFWAVQNGALISGRIRGNKISFSRRTTHLSEVVKMSNGGHLPPSIDGAYVTGKEDKHRLVLFTGNSVYVGIPNRRRLSRYTIPAEYPKTFKEMIGCQ